jgi:hypothetical protein
MKERIFEKFFRSRRVETAVSLIHKLQFTRGPTRALAIEHPESRRRDVRHDDPPSSGDVH